MDRIKLSDSIVDMVTEMAEGNPGAARVLVAIMNKTPAIDPQNVFKGTGVILFLDTLRIYGAQIWVLYKYICNEELPMMLALLRAVQLGIVTEDNVREALRTFDTTREHNLDLEDIMKQVQVQLSEFNVC